MKLLDRNDIVQKKNDERRREVEEGRKLIKHHDALRKALAADQTKNEKFRAASIKTVVEDVAVVLKSLKKATTDLKTARTAAAEARKPLDAEWTAVSARRAEIDSLAEDVQTRIAQNAAEEASLSARHMAIDIEVERIQDMRQRAEDMQARAAAALRSAEATDAEAQNAYQQQSVAFIRREQSVQAREEAAANREKANDERSVRLDAKEVAINAEATRVNDLYQTFVRTKKRNGN